MQRHGLKRQMASRQAAHAAAGAAPRQ